MRTGIRKALIVISAAALCLVLSTISAAFDRILLICNEELWNTSPCQDGISTYAADLDSQGYEIVYNTSHAGTIPGFIATGGRMTGNVLLVDEWSEPGGYLSRPDSLRYYIIQRYNESTATDSLRGVVLIGDVAEPRYGDDEGYNPLDIAYMDMDGTWSDTNDDCYFDTRFDFSTPEIWLGRLTPGPLVKKPGALDRPYGEGTSYEDYLATQAQIIHTYFDRVHAYRQGTLTRSPRALVYNDDDQVG